MTLSSITCRSNLNPSISSVTSYNVCNACWMQDWIFLVSFPDLWDTLGLVDGMAGDGVAHLVFFHQEEIWKMVSAVSFLIPYLKKK